MLPDMDGGYDDGYSTVVGFWGKDPSSLVSSYLANNSVNGLRAIDVGAGEGKNAAALAYGGAYVDAIECSPIAIRNGKILFPTARINWIQQDACGYVYPQEYYDLVVCYGLIHCLGTARRAHELLLSLKRAVKRSGAIILASFNDGSHDLSAHPGFTPLLLPHDWYLSQFTGWRVSNCSSSILMEAHPHNLIPHHHSLTRLIAEK